jgi:hypothetical protein
MSQTKKGEVPEITNPPKQSFLRRFMRYVLRPLEIEIQTLVSKVRWREHSDPRELKWDWQEPNYNRIALVNLLLQGFRQPRYLEIGCSFNSLFDSVSCDDKTGVDPIRGGNVRKTSDDFFAHNADFFDVVFIDGLHTYDQVRKDIQNALDHLAPNGWIAMHDMLPRNWKEQHVPQIPNWPFWTGDVWKASFDLAKTKGIDFRILAIDHGVAVIRKTDNNPVELADLRDLLEDKQFDFFFDNHNQLPILTWADGREWISKAAQGSN